MNNLLGNKKLLLLLVILVGIGGFFGWKILSKKNGEAPVYQTAPVGRGMIISSVSASGGVISANVFEVTTKASGIVGEVFVKDGDEVVKGQKLMEITLNQDGEQELGQKYAAYLSASNSLESAKTRQLTLESTMLSENQVFEDVKNSNSYQTESEQTDFHTAENDWLAAKRAYENQQSVIDQAGANLKNARLAYEAVSPQVLAPISGTLVSLSFTQGMDTGAAETGGGERASQRVATIAVEGLPLASFNLSEIDVAQIVVGQKATVTLDSLSNKTFTGEVVSVDRVGRVTSNVAQYPVVVRFDTASPQILPNMAATANIVIASKDGALLVPSSAVTNQNGQNLVRILKGAREISSPVEVGLVSDTQTEILSGVSEGDLVITGTASTSSSGESVSSPFSGGGGMMRMMPH